MKFNHKLGIIFLSWWMALSGCKDDSSFHSNNRSLSSSPDKDQDATVGPESTNDGNTSTSGGEVDPKENNQGTDDSDSDLDYDVDVDVQATQNQQSGSDVKANAIKSHKPALAVRGTACLMCHAKISSNLITDFGYGDQWFFGRDPVTQKTVIEKDGGKKLFPNRFFYGDYNHSYSQNAAGGFDFAKGGTVSWRSATIKSADDSVITISVPANASFDDSNGSYIKPFKDVETYTRVITEKAANPNNGKIEVKAYDRVYIGAPTRDQLLKALPLSFGGGLVGWKSDDQAPLPELNITDKDKESALLTINNKIDCNGDLLFDGIVVFRSDNDSAEITINSHSGCRIYATKTIFVEGDLVVKDSNDQPSDESLANIQLVSSNAILLGVGGCGKSTKLIDKRLDDGGKVAYTRSDPEAKIIIPQIKKDFALALTKDASCLGKTKRNVAFDRILLNAPIVHSRFQGPFRGVVIAEIFLASLEKFEFSFDPVFERAAVIPILDSSIYLQLIE